MLIILLKKIQNIERKDTDLYCSLNSEDKGILFA